MRRRRSSSPPQKANSDPARLNALAQYALRFVKAGQTIGLGTGRAASAFIRAVAESGIRIRGIPTSAASAELARSLKIELTDFTEVRRLDADFDGADEVDSRLNLVKGRGGAMVREKVVAVGARKRIFLVGSEKRVKRLGERGNLPLEVVPFAAPLALREVAKLGLKPKIRIGQNGHEFITDNGNLVFDCRTTPIKSAMRLEAELRAVPGVVGTGLFLGIADIVLIVSDGGKITTLRRRG
jgi:ribose 5-phosphate isomerase A